ncbi:hypothetical protein IscW_ISCW017175 [Ixodes scapularis]|uniref:Uncharacterized protein n=1 Tax=Ixodes scapularis TaxID=6945 RepID=B7PAC3_IXOSC|nr:hypothetical protein IscW_ISCW017175 [Ixodes scapularis]|eukprot:XP_002406720.1 hypothetical protein IscW_ISCW017175 [Ixodes scapularis]
MDTAPGTGDLRGHDKSPEVTETSCGGVSGIAGSGSWQRIFSAISQVIGGKTYTLPSSSSNNVDDIIENTYTIASKVPEDGTYSLVQPSPKGGHHDLDPCSASPDSTFVYVSDRNFQQRRQPSKAAPATTKTPVSVTRPQRHGRKRPNDRRFDHLRPGQLDDSQFDLSRLDGVPADRHGAAAYRQDVQNVPRGHGLRSLSAPLLLTRRQLFLYPLAVAAALAFLASLLALVPFANRLSFETRHEKDAGPPPIGGSILQARPLDLKRCTSAPCRRDGAFLSHQLALFSERPCQNFGRFVCLHWRPREGSGARSSAEDEVLNLEALALGWLRARPELSSLLDSCIRDRQDGDKALRGFLLPAVSLENFPYSGSNLGSVAIWRAAGRVLLLTNCATLVSAEVASDGSPALGLPQTLGDGGTQSEKAYRALTTAAGELSGSQSEAVVQFAVRLEKAARLGAGGPPRRIPASQLAELWAFLGQLRRGLASGALVTLLAPGYVRRVRDLVRHFPADAVLNYLALRLHLQVAPLLPVTDALPGVYAKLTGRQQRWRQCFNLALSFAPTAVLEATRSVTGASFQVLEALDLADAIRDEVGTLVRESPELRDATQRLSALGEAGLQAFGPPWMQEPGATSRFLSSAPRIRAGAPALRSWSALATYEVRDRLVRESWPGEWALERSCRLDAASKRIALPPLLFNETLPGGLSGPLQLARAGSRLAACLLRGLLSSTDSTMASWPPQAAAHLRSSRACLDAQRRDMVRDALPEWAALRPVLRLFLHRGGEDLSIDGLTQITGTQLFFVYWALDRCGFDDTPGSGTVTALPNAALANEPAFHEAFLCQPQSSMNPLPRCSLWRMRSLRR